MAERTLEEAHLEIAVLKTELKNSSTALDKAEKSLAARLDELNHARRDLIGKPEFEKFTDNVNLRLSILDEWRNKLSGGASTVEWMRMVVFALVALGIAAVAYLK